MSWCHIPAIVYPLIINIAGTCYVMNVFSRSWQPSGGALTLYRRHASLSRVGRYLLSVGGYRYSGVIAALAFVSSDTDV